MLVFVGGGGRGQGVVCVLCLLHALGVWERHEVCVSASESCYVVPLPHSLTLYLTLVHVCLLSAHVTTCPTPLNTHCKQPTLCTYTAPAAVEWCC